MTSLQGCSQLTGACLTAIGQNCCSLKYLDISHCSGISLEESEHLELHLQSLHTLHKQGLISYQCLNASTMEPKNAPPPPPRKLCCLPRQWWLNVIFSYFYFIAFVNEIKVYFHGKVIMKMIAISRGLQLNSTGWEV
jgi:hypothetical protein